MVKSTYFSIYAIVGFLCLLSCSGDYNYEGRVYGEISESALQSRNTDSIKIKGFSTFWVNNYWEIGSDN